MIKLLANGLEAECSDCATVSEAYAALQEANAAESHWHQILGAASDLAKQNREFGSCSNCRLEC